MGDLFNTKNGQYGFVIKYPDGTILSEFDCVWDHVPLDKPIQSIAIFDTLHGTELVELIGYDKFFFSNEATFGSDVGTQQVMVSSFSNLVAKILGGVNIGVGVDEVRINLLHSIPESIKLQYHPDKCPFAPHAMRPGTGRAI